MRSPTVCLCMALASAIAGAAQAQTAVFPFVLRANEKAVVTYRDGRFTNLAIRPHTDEAEIAPKPPGAAGSAFGSVKEPVAPEFDDALTFTFWSAGRDGSRLRLANGLARPVIYAARMVTSDGGEHPTTICSVPSGKVGFETWQTELAAIKITGVYDAPRGQTVCGYADRGQLIASPP